MHYHPKKLNSTDIIEGPWYPTLSLFPSPFSEVTTTFNLDPQPESHACLNIVTKCAFIYTL